MGRIRKKQTAVQKQKKQKKIMKRQQDNLDKTISSKKNKNVFSVLKKQGKDIKSNNSASFIANNDNVFNRWIQFLREVKVEFKKVTWPLKIQTVGSTVVVIVLVVCVSFYLGLVDVILSSLIRLVLH